MHVCSTVLHGGCLGRRRSHLGHVLKWVRVLPFYSVWSGGGRIPPQGSSPKVMVNCVCNLPYGGPRGSFGALGVREVLGRIVGVLGEIEGVPGRFWKGPGGPLEKVMFFCLKVHL